MSTNMCDIHINGLPIVLTGNIILDLSIVSLFGIQVLTDVRCEVTFTKHEYLIKYNGATILRSKKDATTDLWTLPLGTPGMTSQHVTNILSSAAPVFADAHAHSATQIVFFTHTVRTSNSI
jgi:hypothetical protein